MPVVEITQLRLKGLLANDPLLLDSLSLARDGLQSNSRFFSCIQDPSLVYIFGFWESLDAHLQFLVSPARDEILGPQEAILDFQWTIHLDLDTISPSFFKAPLIALHRIECDAGQIDTCDLVINEYVQNLRIAPSSKVLYGWLCDAPAGSREAAVFASWHSNATIDAEAGIRVALGGSNDNGICREILFHYARNMESVQS